MTCVGELSDVRQGHIPLMDEEASAMDDTEYEVSPGNENTLGTGLASPAQMCRRQTYITDHHQALVDSIQRLATAFCQHVPW